MLASLCRPYLQTVAVSHPIKTMTWCSALCDFCVKRVICIPTSLSVGSYRDFYYPECSAVDRVAETRHAYCLHALNHVLKANSRVLTHNAVLKEAKSRDEDEFRDQGLTRPKVNIH